MRNMIRIYTPPQKGQKNKQHVGYKLSHKEQQPTRKPPKIKNQPTKSPKDLTLKSTLKRTQCRKTPTHQ